jgi:hypothetical protein
MRTCAVICLAALILPAAVAGAQEDFEYILPAFAYHHPGVGDNLWSSEVFITNPNSLPAMVRLGDFLPGQMDIPVPCYPPQGIPREVPPLSTIVWPARDVAREFGCATEIVGGLSFLSDRELSITSRMVNEKVVDSPVEDGFIPGFGLEVPASASDEATVPDERLLIPTLVWHPEACANPAFETAIGVVNLEQQAVTVTLSFTGDDRPDQVVINHRPTISPFEFTVRRRGWKQVSLGPPEGEGGECKPPRVFDVVLDPSGSVIVYATVVDRSTQDGRVVQPVPIIEGSTAGGR